MSWRVAARSWRARRQQRQRGDRALLDAGWARLRQALAARRRWIDNLARAALARLPRGSWTVTGPAAWDRAEREALAQQLASALGAAPAWIEDRGIGAGLRFCVGGACLDGTLEGLLADRPAVEAMMLAEMNRQD